MNTNGNKTSPANAEILRNYDGKPKHKAHGGNALNQSSFQKREHWNNNNTKTLSVRSKKN
jgi:hypothetical protein